MKTPSKELVVALWDREFNWLNEINPDVKITKYNKNVDTFKPGEILISPNVGRDVHTFFYHLANSYDNLADYTFFSQDYKDDHVMNYQTIINDDVNRIPQHSVQDLGGCWFFYDNPFYATVFECSNDGSPHHPGLPITEIWNMIFDDEMPEVLKFTPAGHFCITKEHAHKRSKESYENILNVLATHELAPWCIERIETYIFNENFKLK